MRRLGGENAAHGFFAIDGHLGGRQHARVDAAHRRDAQEAAVAYLGDDKADFVYVRVEQHQRRVGPSAADDAGERAGRRGRDFVEQARSLFPQRVKAGAFPAGNGRKRRKTRDLFQAFVQKIPSVFILPRAGAADTPKAACGAVVFY